MNLLDFDCYHVLTTVICFIMVRLTFVSQLSANNEVCLVIDFSIIIVNTNLVVPEAATLVAKHCVLH